MKQEVIGKKDEIRKKKYDFTKKVIYEYCTKCGNRSFCGKPYCFDCFKYERFESR